MISSYKVRSLCKRLCKKPLELEAVFVKRDGLVCTVHVVCVVQVDENEQERVETVILMASDGLPWCRTEVAGLKEEMT